ncbi:hypothetical protein OVA26_16215 [Microbacterium sp. SL62]|uniref:hypothetical protein n=1 Tax=Microbacterium sp. SL62 TaxID=2995139 RepID=UPI002273818E|nr:hypothetical protein [Microbacterium sp. SL62]MCY1718481.1 hypothetical protein [Microbacterium sp. SL62]
MTTMIEQPSVGSGAVSSTPANLPAKPVRGRPGKGARDAIVARPDIDLGDTIIYFAVRAHLTPGEYMVKLAAERLDMPEYIPAPMMRTVRVADHAIRNGHYAFTAKPPVEFGAILKDNATENGLSFGDYMVLLAAEALEMPDSKPSVPEQLEIAKEAVPTAA